MKSKNVGGNVGKASGAIKRNHEFKIREIERQNAKGEKTTYYTVDLGKIDRGDGKGPRRTIRTFSTRTDAELEAERIAKHEKKIGEDAKRLTKDDLDDAADALALLGHKVSLVTAAKFYLQNATGEDGEITVAEMFNNWIAAKAGKNLREKTLSGYRNLCSKFVETLGAEKAHHVTIKQVDAFLNERASATDKDNHRRALHNLFNFGIKRRNIRFNPVAAVERPVIDKHGVAVLNVEQVRDLLKAAAEIEPRMIPYFAIGCFAGLRPSEISRLDWKRIDFEHRTIEVTGAFSKRRQLRRNVRIEDNLLAWLSAHKPATNEGALFHARRSEDLIRKKAGLFGRGIWVQDVMRHSYASYHFEAFGSAATTAKNMGDNEKTVEQHYRSVVKPADASTYWKIMPDTAEKNNKPQQTDV